jgi:predicted ABC-class ATPase
VASTQEQIRERNTYRVGEDWNRDDEQDKVDVFNNVFQKNSWALERARELISKYYDPSKPDSAVIGHLYWLAYNNLNSAVNEAKTHDVDKEKFEAVVTEFEETAPPRKMKEWSRIARENRQQPAKLRRVLEEHGNKIDQLISFAYAGTEAVKEGASDEDEDSIIG